MTGGMYAIQCLPEHECGCICMFVSDDQTSFSVF